MEDKLTIVIIIIVFVSIVTWIRISLDNWKVSMRSHSRPYPRIGTVVTPSKKPRVYDNRLPSEIFSGKKKDDHIEKKDIPQNILSPQTNQKWFISEWGIGKPSAAEQLIINELNKYHIKWEREVSFFGLQLATKGWARFDFLLIDHILCIEYDGKLSHNSPARKEVDEIKTQFCKDNNIRLIRYSGEHYYHMELHISRLMKELNIPIKRK